MDSAELLIRIRKELMGAFESPGKEWKTSKQWGKEWGLASSQTGRLLSAAVAAGLMERRTFRVQCETRPCYPKPHFRVKKTDDTGISKVLMKGFEKPE